MDRSHTPVQDSTTGISDHAHPQRAPRATRPVGGRQALWLVVTLFMSAVVLAACSSGAKVTPVTTATVQAAATQIAPTAAAARTAIAPTAAAAQTAAVPSVTAAVATVQSAASAVQPTVAAASTQTAATVQTTGTQVAPTVVAAQTQVSSTVQTGATQTAPTIAAAQTAIAPTAIAAQTAVAPTRNALATQAVATFGPPIATSTAASPVQITSVRVNQADTTIAVNNSGTGAVSISAWILTLGTFPYVLPLSPNLRIQPNATVTMHLSRGTDTATDVYLGQAPDALVNNLKSGDRVALLNLLGQVASVYQLP